MFNVWRNFKKLGLTKHETRILVLCGDITKVFVTFKDFGNIKYSDFSLSNTGLRGHELRT